MVIGITGGSGSGKTAFIKAIRNKFSGNQLAIISEDNYYKPRNEQKADLSGVLNFDIPEAIDENKFVEDVHKLIGGSAVRLKEYTFNNQLATVNEIQIDPAPILIVEGLFILHRPRIRNLLDLSILIHARDELKLIRRIRRDQEERNYPLEDVLYRYENHVSPAYQLYIQPYLDKVDLSINNNDHFTQGVEILAAYISVKLGGI
ncbi:MAG: uridine kinase [Saprospiraceae bacterium]|nr:uridine kinase [Saprospiraceae bacterium]